MNPAITNLDKDRERNRLLKLSTFVVVDFVKVLVHKIERENEVFKQKINKQDYLYLVNKSEDEDYLRIVDNNNNNNEQK